MDNYSVLMSVYYKEKPEWLRQAIESMLNQTIVTNDFVIVCDGILTDELYSILDYFDEENPGLFQILKREKNYGLGPSLAYGIEFCKNELIARMDSDDICKENRCEIQLKYFQENPNLDMVGCWENEFEEDNNNPIAVHMVPSGIENVSKFMRRRCAVLHPTVIYKKSAVIKSGNYHDVRLFEDYDLFMRMIVECKCNADNVPEALYDLRVNDNFYKRRGGFKYMKTIVKFKKEQRKKGYMSFKDYIISCWTQRIVCLMPNKMRKWFYLKFLRR